MKLSELAVDSKAQEEGLWREHPYFDGVEVLMRSRHSEEPRKRSRVLMNRLGRKARKPGDAAEEAENIERHVLSECVKDWRGIENEAGDSLEFSRDLIRSWVDKPEMRRFFEGLAEMEFEVSQVSLSEVEETSGN